MFTEATIFPIFNIITPGALTHTKQSNIFHAKQNSKVKPEKQYLREPKVIV